MERIKGLTSNQIIAMQRGWEQISFNNQPIFQPQLCYYNSDHECVQRSYFGL